MDAVFAIVRAQRWLLAIAVVASAVLVHIGEGDIFALPKATAVAVCAVLALGLSLMRWAWSRALSLPAEPTAVAAGLFVAGLAVTTITSTTPAQSLVGQYSQHAGLAAYAAYAVLFVLVLRTHSPATLPSLVRTFVGSAVVVVGYALLQASGVDPVDWALEGRVVGTLGNPNFLAGWVGIVLPLALWSALHRGHHVAWRVAGACVALAIPVVAVETASFQGPVTVAASTAAFALFALRVPRRWLLGGAAVAAVVVVVLAPRIRTELEDGLLEREHFWAVALEIGADHLLVGTGPDTFHNQFLPRRPPEHAAIPAGKNAGAAHNVPLDHLAGGGLLVLLPYLAFVGLVGWRLARGLRLAEGEHRLLLAGIGAAWVGYQVQSLVSIDKPPLALAHFVLAGAVVVGAGPTRWLDVMLPGTAPGLRERVPPATWVVSGVAVVVALASAWVVTRPQRADLAYAAGVDALQAGDGRGIGDIERALELAPWEARYTFELARGRLAAGDQEGALAAAAEGARLEPGDSSYPLVPAQLASQLGRDGEASEWYDRALEIDPYGIDVLGAAAEHAAAVGDEARAAALADRLLGVTRDRADVWATVYRVRARIGDTDGAVLAGERARALDPDIELEEGAR